MYPDKCEGENFMESKATTESVNCVPQILLHIQYTVILYVHNYVKFKQIVGILHYKLTIPIQFVITNSFLVLTIPAIARCIHSIATV